MTAPPRLQVIIGGITQFDADVESMEFSTDIRGNIALTATSEPVLSDFDLPTRTPWTDPFTYERLDGK